MTTLSSVEQFRSSGAIVSRQPVKKHIEWTTVDPETNEEVKFDAFVYLLKPGAGLMSDMFTAEDKHLTVTAVQTCLRLPETVEVEGEKPKLVQLTYDDVFNFDSPFLAAIWKELTFMSGITKKNDSAPPTNSTLNSLSPESVETP